MTPSTPQTLKPVRFQLAPLLGKTVSIEGTTLLTSTWLTPAHQVRRSILISEVRLTSDAGQVVQVDHLWIRLGREASERLNRLERKQGSEALQGSTLTLRGLVWAYQGAQGEEKFGVRLPHQVRIALRTGWRTLKLRPELDGEFEDLKRGLAWMGFKLGGRPSASRDKGAVKGATRDDVPSGIPLPSRQRSYLHGRDGGSNKPRSNPSWKGHCLTAQLEQFLAETAR